VAWFAEEIDLLLANIFTRVLDVSGITTRPKGAAYNGVGAVSAGVDDERSHRLSQ